ncbi:SRPBCC domain-containing protein [Streptosporangium sp. NPDC048047]|uniref:SRPBCC family protein n=1 Tax=Streptosporangium sp. NPDC048047 TaxID=3155748 RepID=UPI00343838B7
MTGDDPTVLHLDQFLPHPPAKVWRALTEPELIARWLMPGDFRLEVGHRYTMRGVAMPGTGFSGVVQAEVLTFTPGRMLRLGWRDAAPGGGAGVDWTVTWTLEPEGTGTRLFLTHEGFDPDDPSSGGPTRSWAAAGGPASCPPWRRSWTASPSRTLPG